MKKINFILSAAVLFSVVSCSDFLSEVPDNRTQLDSPEKIEQLLVNAYPKSVPYGFFEIMSDNAGDTKQEDKSELDNTTYFRFQDYDESNFDSPAWVWEKSYYAIAHANQALEAIDKLGNPKSLDYLRGEALLARAYNHLALVNVFAQAYDPATASSEPGVPVVDQVESSLIVHYKRKSVAEVYDAVEADIIEGLPLIKDRNKQKGYHFNKAAAKALAARFYLYKGDWDKVLEFSNDLGDYPVNKLRVWKNFTNLPFETAMKGYASQAEPTNLLLSAGNSVMLYQFAFYRYGMNKDITKELFDGRNYNVLNKSWNYRKESYQGYDNSFMTKYFAYFINEGGNTTSGQPYTSYVLLNNDELYLNRIEATIMKGDLDKAAKMMGYFSVFKSRGAELGDQNQVSKQTVLNLSKKPNIFEPFYALNSDQKAFIEVLTEMRRRDLAQEGGRWIDIKRFNLEVIHYDGVAKVEYKLEKRDNRKAVQLPSHVAQYGVELNKR